MTQVIEEPGRGENRRGIERELKRGSLELITVPEKSMPPMHEARRRILPLPVAASASL